KVHHPHLPAVFLGGIAEGGRRHDMHWRADVYLDVRRHLEEVLASEQRDEALGHVLFEFLPVRRRDLGAWRNARITRGQRKRTCEQQREHHCRSGKQQFRRFHGEPPSVRPALRAASNQTDIPLTTPRPSINQAIYISNSNESDSVFCRQGELGEVAL